MQIETAEALISETSETTNVLHGTGADNIDSSEDEFESVPTNTAEKQGTCKRARLQKGMPKRTTYTCAIQNPRSLK